MVDVWTDWEGVKILDGIGTGRLDMLGVAESDGRVSGLGVAAIAGAISSAEDLKTNFLCA
jgi:hypothetical protein